MKHRLMSCLLSLLPFVSVLLSSCGGSTKMTNPGPGNPAQTTNLRVVNGDGGITSVNVLVNGASVASNVTFLTQTNYAPVPAGQIQLTINGLEPPNTSLPENLPANANNTLVISGCGPIPGGFTVFGGFNLITDDLTPPAPGNFKLRIVDGAIETSGLSVFVLPASSAPSGTPAATNMSMGENTPYLSFAAGTYHIIIAQIDTNATIILFDSGPINFGAGQNRTYYLFQNGVVISTQTREFGCGLDFKPVLVADLN